MTARHLLAVGWYTPGPHQPARLPRLRGWTVVDTRTGRIALTEPHPISGRARPAIVPSLDVAIRAAYDLDAPDRA